MAGAIARTTQDLTSAADMRNTTQMLMQPNANWEGYLTPAPLSIAIMAELVFISSIIDFSINKNPPKDGFKYIKYPDSFRASLMQISNSGWHAFNLAHKNMDQIRIHTSTVPDYMKTVVKILFQGNDEIVETLLPNQLENIHYIADECVVLAESVEKKYEYVINIIQELLEACINAEHVYGEELENVRMKLEENKLKEQTSKELNERSKKAMEAMSKELEETQEQYRKAMDSIPSGWETIGMDLVETLTFIPKMFSFVLGSSNNNKRENVGSETNTENKDEDVDMISEMKIYSKSGQILQLASLFSQFINSNGINWKEIYDQKNKNTKTTWAEDQFKRLYQELEDLPRSQLKENALCLCQRGIDICEQLAQYAPDQECDEKTTKKLIKETKKLHEDARKFDSKSKKKVVLQL
ncbi:uncharacterized protein LOC112138920 [Oryzias melastigma]|nr:uncharacterized protein LOC112138920 [Oryzias melastigma]